MPRNFLSSSVLQSSAVIACKREHLAQRCAERGYLMDDVRDCIVSQDGDDIVVDETHPKYPHPRSPLNRSSSDVTWLEKAKNFAVASAQHVAAGMPTCSDEEIIRRHDICMGCEFFKDSTCSKCGCPIKRDREFISKLAWADQSCPVGKWGPVNS
jgi:hypothetical protein